MSISNELQKLRNEFLKNKKEFEEQQYTMKISTLVLNNFLLKTEEDVYFFRYENDLERNQRSEREFMQMFTCCNRGFERFSEFIEHKETVHNEGRVEEVVTENKAITIFEDPKPYKCTYLKCTKMYTSMNGLKYHQEKGHETEDEDLKPYRCKMKGCTKRYKNSNGLKYHSKHGH